MISVYLLLDFARICQSAELSLFLSNNDKADCLHTDCCAAPDGSFFMLGYKAEHPHRMPRADNDAERRQRRPPLRLCPVGKRHDDSSKGWTDSACHRDVCSSKPHTGSHQPLAMAAHNALRRAAAHHRRQPPARRQQRRAVTNLRHRLPVNGLCLCHTPHHHLADSLFFTNSKKTHVAVSNSLRGATLLLN